MAHKKTKIERGKEGAQSSAAKKSESEAVPLPIGGRFNYEGLDRVMHEKARLGILASLAAHERGLLFNDLKQLCSLTDGNLSRHLGVLSDAELVEVWKGVGGNRQQTMYRLTAEGRKRFAEYIGVLEKVIEDAQARKTHSANDKQSASDDLDLAGGWSPA